MCTVCWIWVDWKGLKRCIIFEGPLRNKSGTLGPVTNLLKLAHERIAALDKHDAMEIQQQITTAKKHKQTTWWCLGYIYYIILYYIILYYIIVYYIILYYIVLYYIILYYIMYIWILYIYIYGYIVFERGCIVVYLMPARFLQSFWTWSRAGIQQGLSFCARALHFTPTGIARWSLGLPPIEPVVVWNCLRNKNALILHSMMSARETRD